MFHILILFSILCNSVNGWNYRKELTIDTQIYDDVIFKYNDESEVFILGHLNIITIYDFFGQKKWNFKVSSTISDIGLIHDNSVTYSSLMIMFNNDSSIYIYSYTGDILKIINVCGINKNNYIVTNYWNNSYYVIYDLGWTYHINYYQNDRFLHDGFFNGFIGYSEPSFVMNEQTDELYMVTEVGTYILNSSIVIKNKIQTDVDGSAVTQSIIIDNNMFSYITQLNYGIYIYDTNGTLLSEKTFNNDHIHTLGYHKLNNLLYTTLSSEINQPAMNISIVFYDLDLNSTFSLETGYQTDYFGNKNLYLIMEELTGILIQMVDNYIVWWYPI
jgi:hypothetical protein